MSQKKTSHPVDPALWVEEHTDYLLNFAKGRVGSMEVAQDLVQETFLKAIRNKDGFRGDSSARTWLTAILKRLIIDHWRKEDVRKTKPYSHYFREGEKWEGHWQADRMPRHVDDLRDEIQNRELGMVIDGCIDNLPDKWRVLVNKRMVEGESTEEICKELGITSSNLWVMIHRAKLQLRECIETRLTS